MSASRKKMLRREENKAAMTERQQQEMKEAKKLKVYTALFTAAIVIMIAVVLVTSFFSSGIIERNTTALTVGEDKISSVELNYYYIDSVNGFLNNYGSYASLFGLDTTKALDEQFYDEAAEQTWADYFVESAASNAQRTHALYKDAQANGYTLPEDAAESIDATMDNFDLYAAMYGFANGGDYIKAVYGAGSNENTFREYLTMQYVAEYYYNDTYEGLSYTDEELRAAEAENYGKYSSFSYDYYYLAASKFYEGGTENEDGTTTYSDEEKAAGAAKAKEAADSLLTATNLEELNAAIAALEINAESTSASATSVSDRLYSSVDATLRDWIASGDRKTGDITVIESSTTTIADHEHTEEAHEHEEIKTISGYYVVLWNGADSNLNNLVNVRHILLNHEGGTQNENGTTTYSDEEKAATKTKAEELLASFTGTEEDFAALANENSDDTGSNTNGGLYENVYPGQMVTNFNDWCFDESRKPGDTGIVESEYGYHVMYFSGLSEMTYRDYMITNELRSADISEWETALIEATELNVLDTSKVEKGLVLTSGSSDSHEGHDHD